MGTRLYYVDYDNIKYINVESEELKNYDKNKCTSSGKRSRGIFYF